MWPAVVVGALGCYLIKLAGYVVPESWLSTPLLRRITALIPVALLSALIGLWTFVDGTSITIDARIVGVAFAIVALLLRAPFLVVIVGAAATTAIVRALGWLP